MHWLEPHYCWVAISMTNTRRLRDVSLQVPYESPCRYHHSEPPIRALFLRKPFTALNGSCGADCARTERDDASYTKGEGRLARDYVAEAFPKKKGASRPRVRAWNGGKYPA